MRIVRGSLVAVACLTAGLAGCLSSIIPDHGDKAQNGQSGGGDMAGAAAPTDMGGVGSGGNADLATQCLELSLDSLDGHHNPGLDCLTCHNGTTTVKFTIAGTLYDAVTAGNPVAKAHIEITDANGQKIPITTATNPAGAGAGNFWYDQPVAFPIKVRASGCPNDVPMIGAVDEAGGSCNKSGCHSSTMQVHLP